MMVINRPWNLNFPPRVRSLQFSAPPRLLIATVLCVLSDILCPVVCPGPAAAGPPKVNPALEAAQHTIQAHKAFDAKNYAEAVREATIAINSPSKGNSATYWIRGASLVELGKPEAALQDLNACTFKEALPASLVHEFKARCYIEMDKCDAAVKELDQAIALRPMASLYRMKGEIHYQRKHDDLAVQSFKKALSLDPKDYWSNRDLASIYDSQKNYADALKCCNRMIEMRPGEPEGYGLRARIYQHMGKLDLAKKDREQNNRKSDFPF